MGSEDSSSSLGNASTETAGRAPDKNPAVAALLSGIGLVVPIAAGAGQVYNGDTIRGVVFSVIQIVNALLFFVLIGFVTYPLFGIYAVYDAYKGPEAPLYDLV